MSKIIFFIIFLSSSITVLFSAESLCQKLIPFSSSMNFPDNKLITPFNKSGIVIYPVIEQEIKLVFNKITETTNLQIITNKEKLPENLRIETGRNIVDPVKEILIEKDIAAQLDLRIGDKVFLGSTAFFVAGTFYDPYFYFTAIINNKALSGVPKSKQESKIYVTFPKNRDERDLFEKLSAQSYIISNYKLISPSINNCIIKINNNNHNFIHFNPGKEFDIPLSIDPPSYIIKTNDGLNIKFLAVDNNYSKNDLTEIKSQISQQSSLGTLIDNGKDFYLLYQIIPEDVSQSMVQYGAQGLIDNYLFYIYVNIPDENKGDKIKQHLFDLYQKIIKNMTIDEK